MRAGCIESQIVILDGTLSTGFRSSLSFMSSFSPDDLATFDAALHDAADRYRAVANAHQCRHLVNTTAPVLAALHHPLVVSQYPPQTPQVPRSIVAPGRVTFQRLHELLASHRVSLVVSGHLHDAFGQRLHGFHALQEPHRPPTAPDAPAQAQQRLLEAEAADWKFRRRFRIISMQGDAVSFTDARFVVTRTSMATSTVVQTVRGGHGMPSKDGQSGEERTCRVHGEDAAALSEPYLIHIVEPPDARYFPARTATAGWSLRWVHATLFWTHGLSPGESNTHPPAMPVRIEAVVSCVDGQARTLWQQNILIKPHKAAGSNNCPGAWPLQASAPVPDCLLDKARACEEASHSLHLHILADGGRFGSAASDRRQIRTRVAVGDEPLPMGTTPLEGFVITTSWPRFALKMYLASLLAALAVLVATRLLRRLLHSASTSPLGALPSLQDTVLTAEQTVAASLLFVSC
jgi:hypothetical protein